MKPLRSRRARAGHLLVEALAGGAILSLALASLASGEIASRQQLLRGIEELEMERAAAERLETLYAQPSDAPAWLAPSSGPVPGHPDWTWTLTPTLIEDGNLRGATTLLRYRRATVTITASESRTLTREMLRW